MSDKKPKIVDDIVSELREKYASYYYCEESTRRDGEYPEGFDVIDTRKLADSIEEAVKRERAAFDCECAGIAELAAKEEAARHKPGNAAAMREALVAIRDCIKEHPCQLDEDAVFEIVTKALNEKPRNCDLFGGDPKMLNTAWFDWTASPSGHDAIGVAKMTFAGWLLAPAAKRKGENDGR